MIACDVTSVFSVFFNGLGWLFATLTGAAVGIWVANHLDRKRRVAEIQAEILKWADSTPETFLDQYHGEAKVALRDPLYRAIPYMRQQDRERAQKIWRGFRTGLEGKAEEKNEFFEAIFGPEGLWPESKEDAFKRLLDELYQMLEDASRILR